MYYSMDPTAKILHESIELTLIIYVILKFKIIPNIVIVLYIYNVISRIVQLYCDSIIIIILLLKPFLATVINTQRQNTNPYWTIYTFLNLYISDSDLILINTGYRVENSSFFLSAYSIGAEN